jgi:hypothetical protein
MSYPLLVCTASAGTDPCALVTEAEVATALGAPVETKPPHHVRRNGDLVGGDCFYRSRTQSQDGVTISVDEHPGVDREANLGRVQPAERAINPLIYQRSATWRASKSLISHYAN